MEERLLVLSDFNINGSILEVPREEGGLEEDKGLASIGDATQAHIQTLGGSGRQVWEDLISTQSGAIFRVVPSPESTDKDPFNLRGKDLDKYLQDMQKKFRAQGISQEQFDSFKTVLEEAVEEEHARRENSEDAYEHSELLPYEMLQQYPGMEKHIEMPKSPRDLLIWIGDWKQPFYDDFPQGHPDSFVINEAIKKLNQPPHKLNPGYLEFYLTWSYGQHFHSPYVREILSALAWRLTREDGDYLENPAEEISSALRAIDDRWRQKHKDYARRGLEADPLYMLLEEKENEWEEKTRAGINVYYQVKAFGKMLYDEFGGRKRWVGIDGKPVNAENDKVVDRGAVMRGPHWKLYNKLKRIFAPRVNLKGVDLNRARLGEIAEVLGMDRKWDAYKVLEGRPFDSIEHFHAKGFLSREVFEDGSHADELLRKIEEVQGQCMKNKNGKALQKLQTELIKLQRTTDHGVKDWGPVWAYYRIMKNELAKELRTYRQREALKLKKKQEFEEALARSRESDDGRQEEARP